MLDEVNDTLIWELCLVFLSIGDILGESILSVDGDGAILASFCFLNDREIVKVMDRRLNISNRHRRRNVFRFNLVYILLIQQRHLFFNGLILGSWALRFVFFIVVRLFSSFVLLKCLSLLGSCLSRLLCFW